jgi:anti-sigma regulatory factor (Ser/Thr protein kinase)
MLCAHRGRLACPSKGQMVDTSPVLIELPPTPDAVALARRFVSEHGDGLDPELVEDAELLVSELVTNAIKHGKPAILLRVRSEPPGIGVEVTDEGPEEPVISSDEPAYDQHSGRGLRMVAAVASAWGVRRPEDGQGKIVWFTLQPSASAPTA